MTKTLRVTYAVGDLIMYRAMNGHDTLALVLDVRKYAWHGACMLTVVTNSRNRHYIDTDNLKAQLRLISANVA